MEKGNVLRASDASGRAGSLAAFDEAITLLAPLCDSETSPLRDDLASAWAHRGIVLLEAGDPSSLEAALGCFETAISLRKPLVPSGDSWIRYNLMGAWINRGDALARLGGNSRTTEAIASYDEALGLSGSLDLALHPDFPRRVALAHVNRGAVLLQSAGEGASREACLSYEAAVATLTVAGSPTPADPMIAATAWCGKAEALARGGSATESRACAVAAARLVSAFESELRAAAVIGLKARLIRCAGACGELARNAGAPAGYDEVDDAIDTAEDGLKVVGRWRDDEEFQPLIRELFRFGAQGYAARQPQFLPEFIAEHSALALPGFEAPLRQIAGQAVAVAIARVAAEGIQSAGSGDTAGTIALFRELRLAKERLEAAAPVA
jgi:hypothetical protein